MNIDQHKLRQDSDDFIRAIGPGAIGGKAQGLVRMQEVLSQLNPADFGGITLQIPPLVVLATGMFDIFMETNRLYELAYSSQPDERIGRAFQKAELPFEVLGDLRALIDRVHTPLAVRSSGLLEDVAGEPFAGIYATKMIPNNQFDSDLRFRQLVEAIKFIYASTYTQAAKNYCQATGHQVQEEKMAVIIQEAAGKRHHNRFYPELSGVARSYNYYPVKPARPEDGVVSLALGLGKTIVDGGVSWTYSPAYPRVEPPFGSPNELLKGTQTEFWVVNMGEPPEYDPIKETEYLAYENLVAAERDNSLRYLVSTYNPMSGRFSPGVGTKGPRALTFAPLLVLKELPLNDLVIALLALCEKTLGSPVEIEFAMTFTPPRFHFLQVRPMIIPSEDLAVTPEEMAGPGVLLASENVLGNGASENIRDIIYLRPEAFDLRHSRAIATELERFNQALLAHNTPYLLIVFGRLGTADPWLGIPVNWGQICGAKVIVEATQKNVRVELSQGSHYFHNMISLGVKHFDMPFTGPYQVDWNWLAGLDLVEETGFVRHVRAPAPLKVKVDGRSGRGVIFKP